MKQIRKIDTIREDLNGNKILKTPASLGFQVHVGGKFHSFVQSEAEANTILDRYLPDGDLYDPETETADDDQTA